MSSATIRADARLAGKLRHAVEMNEFIVHYQPIVQLTNAAVVGVEALVRWRRTDGTLVPPAEFIPLAEDMGLIVPIGRIVMCEAMRQTSVWQLSSPKMRHLQPAREPLRAAPASAGRGGRLRGCAGDDGV